MKCLKALGGFDAKGPACFLLEIDGVRLLLDMGRGPDAGRRPDLAGIGPVDAVLISHCHADHTGSLDWLARIGAPPVYATAPTRALSDIAILRDAQDLPAFGEIAGLIVETGPAGHAPGAIWMRIGGRLGLVYSGDYAEGLGLLQVSPLPPAEIAILDCSYGVEQDSIQIQTAALLKELCTGPCLVPAPPAGRGLEIALACLDQGLLVSICDHIRAVAETLIGFPDWLAEGGAVRLRSLLQQARSLRPGAPLAGIMIAAGANCGSGLSQELGPRALTAEVPVIFTGHLSQGSPAAAWVQEGRAKRLRWNVHPDRTALKHMLTQTGAKLVMPAFATRKARQNLIAAFPEIRWATNQSITW